MDRMDRPARTGTLQKTFPLPDLTLSALLTEVLAERINEPGLHGMCLLSESALQTEARTHPCLPPDPAFPPRGRLFTRLTTDLKASAEAKTAVRRGQSNNTVVSSQPSIALGNDHTVPPLYGHYQALWRQIQILECLAHSNVFFRQVELHHPGLGNVLHSLPVHLSNMTLRLTQHLAVGSDDVSPSEKSQQFSRILPVYYRNTPNIQRSRAAQCSLKRLIRIRDGGV